MTAILIAFVMLCLVTAKYKNPFNKEVFENNFDKDKTECINGIFVVLVFMSHFHWEIENFFVIDNVYNHFQTILGQCIVCSFLFYSGFGIYEGLKKDRNNYRRIIMVKKFPNLLLRFDFCVLLYAITQLCLGNTFSIKTFVLSLLTILNLGNSNWYISYVLLLYIMTWISFTIFKDDRKSIGMIILLNIVYLLLFRFMYRDAAHYYFTCFIYPLGMLWSRYKENLQQYISKFFVLVFLAAFIFYVLVWYVNRKLFPPANIFYNVVSVMFTIVLILITYKIQLKNRLLTLLGRNVFEVYIMQHLPMIVFKPIQNYCGGGYIIYLILCVITTGLLVWGIKAIFKKIKAF